MVSPPPFVQLAAHPVRWRLLTALAAGDYRVRELVELVDEPQNLVSYHLRLLRGGGLVKAGRSSFDGRDSYYHLDLDRCAQALSAASATLHPALRLNPTPPAASAEQSPRVAVLFLCTGNSARSPIAEALLRHHTGGHVDVASAGSHPKQEIHPNAVQVLRNEYGIDVTGQRPRNLNTMVSRRFDRVISLCDRVREVCPEFPDHPHRTHWSIPDPAKAGDTDETSYPAFQRTAADIDNRIRYLLPTLDRPSHQEVQP